MRAARRLQGKREILLGAGGFMARIGTTASSADADATGSGGGACSARSRWLSGHEAPMDAGAARAVSERAAGGSGGTERARTASPDAARRRTRAPDSRRSAPATSSRRMRSGAHDSYVRWHLHGRPAESTSRAGGRPARAELEPPRSPRTSLVS
jgi:hypothetical protein